MEIIKRVLPGMRERRFGRVVAVSSAAVKEPIPTLQLSNAHRPGLIAAFKILAKGSAADGVTFNTLLPGSIDTDRIRGTSSDADMERLAASMPAKRLGRPDEMGAAAAFLCSVQAEYVNGTTLLVDGARTASV
jgi:3-oxoacyl-[acyl-carrier protein] reductase